MAPSDLAKAGGVRLTKAESWLNGTEQPTYRQAKVIAHRLQVSLGQLLLPPPEHVEFPLPDFRRGSMLYDQPSPELTETIYDALRKRDWWREYQRGRRLSFVGSFDWRESTPAEVAKAIRRFIPIETLAKEARDLDTFLRMLSRRAEDIGILVLRKGVVGNNTNRPLDPNEFSGFAVADDVAPIIVINTKDYAARRNFTFAHELAHIWLGQSAVDDNLELETKNSLEQFCDQVAAELLVPGEAIMQVWDGRPLEAATSVAKRFWVSVWVAAKRALDLGLIGIEDYQSVLATYYKDLHRDQRKSARADFHNSVTARNSPTFTKAVVDAVHHGELTFKEAASLLNLSIKGFLGHLERQANELPS